MAALAVGLAGCTAPASNVSVTGTSLTIYASVPPHGAGGQQAQDVLDAEQLAFQQAGSQVGSFKLKLVRVDGNEPSADARTAIQDTSAIAYIGELTSGASADSVGITNAQGLLQVSPTDTAVALTQSTPAVPNAPNRYYESLSTYGRTFARVVPNATQEAKAQVSEMQALHVTKLYLTTDGSAYGAAIEDANLSGWKVHDVNLSGLKITQANLQGASIRDSRIDGMTINGILVTDLLAAYQAGQGSQPQAD